MSGPEQGGVPFRLCGSNFQSLATVEFDGVAGPAMTREGLTSLFPISDTSVMGLKEVVPKIPIILRRVREVSDRAVATRPDLVVLIDSPDFTHRIARRLKRRWIGIEREPAYVKVARTRIASTLPLDESAMSVMADKRAAPKVAFGLLVESGMCPAGTLLTDSKRRFTARVRADGSIQSGTHSGSIHKVGAALQSAPSCNGWTFWHVDEAGELQPLDSLRQRHLSAL